MCVKKEFSFQMFVVILCFKLLGGRLFGAQSPGFRALEMFFDSLVVRYLWQMLI